ncbi:CvpA family protein [Candidatus Endowatersipora endosymbiont of Watersipora subatra]|uniref:CvpA family protein n=1 Tax=Candidatus Endowatersipora endosymbiont of Watersipora subatra TaxID=3077946 RepID=UPI00312C7517
MILDSILIVVMLISAIFSKIRGFSREIMSIFSWIFAAVIAFSYHKFLSSFFSEKIFFISNPLLAEGVSVFLIFLFILFIANYLTMLLADKIITSRVGVLDRTLGFFFGAVRGVFLVVITLIGFLWLANGHEPDWIANAKSKSMLIAIGKEMTHVLPQNFNTFLKKMMNHQPSLKKGHEPIPT